MVVPLQIFNRPVPRLINPANAFEIDCLQRINNTFKITPENIKNFKDTKWNCRGIVVFGEPEAPDISGKCMISLALTKYAQDMLNIIDIGYVWNTIDRCMDLKASRNFYLQYTRPHQYHFYENKFQEATILPQWVARKLHAMNDKRFDDIKIKMQMIMLKADKVRDDWVMTVEES